MNRSTLTLTVVCAATAMLMLDIAVVNTALSNSFGFGGHNAVLVLRKWAE